MERDPIISIPVVYMGGCCGDLVAALIDWKDSKFDVILRKMWLPEERQRLKKHHLFAGDEEKDEFLSTIGQKYLSVPSHDLEYHVRRQHWFIGIAVKNPEVALWAARRFKESHRSNVWAEIEKLFGLNSWEDYARLMLDYSNMIKTKTDNILYLEDIIAGKVAEPLERLLGHELPSKIKNTAYKNWRDVIYNRFII